MNSKNRVVLCIGGNMGDMHENMQEARMFIEFNFGDIIRVSSVAETIPWNMPENTPFFLNQIIEIETELTPIQLWQEIQELEEYFGRQRGGDTYRNREMDVDVLDYNGEIIQEGPIVVPHPRMHERAFILNLMKETHSDYIHPVSKKNIEQLIGELD
jgi:2-amino-4-hydroxy-6-hydroxymethyldihydropteridine diphosphokinase